MWTWLIFLGELQKFTFKPSEWFFMFIKSFWDDFLLCAIVQYHTGHVENCGCEAMHMISNNILIDCGGIQVKMALSTTLPGFMACWIHRFVILVPKSNSTICVHQSRFIRRGYILLVFDSPVLASPSPLPPQMTVLSRQWGGSWLVLLLLKLLHLKVPCGVYSIH